MYLLVNLLFLFLRNRNNMKMTMSSNEIARSPPVTPPAILAADSLEDLPLSAVGCIVTVSDKRELAKVFATAMYVHIIYS